VLLIDLGVAILLVGGRRPSDPSGRRGLRSRGRRARGSSGAGRIGAARPGFAFGVDPLPRFVIDAGLRRCGGIADGGVAGSANGSGGICWARPCSASSVCS
jgi:hypothetical protein